jgi:hypothetical protein
MSITRENAAEALRVVEETAQRSKALRGYQSAAPHLILWGGIYAVAYSGTYFQPNRAGLVWLVLVPTGIIGDVLISWRDRSCVNWALFAGIFLTFFAFVAATMSIMHPRDPRQVAAFVPLVVAAAYAVLGMSLGRRFVFIGLALGLLTLIGFFALSSIFMLWMAAVGGGALVLGGLWLRRV